MTVSTNSFIKQGKSLPEKVREDMIERWFKSTVFQIQLINMSSEEEIFIPEITGIELVYVLI